MHSMIWKVVNRKSIFSIWIWQVSFLLQMAITIRLTWQPSQLKIDEKTFSFSNQQCLAKTTVWNQNVQMPCQEKKVKISIDFQQQLFYSIRKRLLQFFFLKNIENEINTNKSNKLAQMPVASSQLVSNLGMGCVPSRLRLVTKNCPKAV